LIIHSIQALNCESLEPTLLKILFESIFPASIDTQRWSSQRMYAYINLRKRAADPAVRVPWHATRDSESSRFSWHKQERIRKCTLRNGPLYRSERYPLSPVRHSPLSFSGPSSFWRGKECSWPRQFCYISRTLFTKFRASWPQLVRDLLPGVRISHCI